MGHGAERLRMRSRRLRAALLLVLTGAAACGAGPVPATPAGAQELLYVASQEDVTVAVIDMSTRQLVETVDLKELGFSPTAKAHHVAVEPDGSFWYVSLIADGKVLKFDRENRLVGQADFETPGMLGLDPTSDRLYVGRSMAAVNPPQRIGVIDRRSMSIEEIDVFFPRPHALAVDARGSRFFAASLGQNSMAWAPIGDEDVDLLQLEGAMNHVLVQFAISPDGRWMVGGGQMTGSLLVFDLSADGPTVVRSIDVGGQPWHPSWSVDGRTVWVPNQAANTVTATIPPPAPSAVRAPSWRSTRRATRSWASSKSGATRQGWRRPQRRPRVERPERSGAEGQRTACRHASSRRVCRLRGGVFG
ncbi:MAG: hypothetical protein AMS19_08325 [Gemmatimonas sp. SG8_23]|nr:MAG: hypothetical protein AMS19_08325 [Gemmatimonas sp. SG8_23]